MIKNMDLVRVWMQNDGICDAGGTIDVVLQHYEVPAEPLRKFALGSAKQMVSAANHIAFQHVAPDELTLSAFGLFIDGFLTGLGIFSINGYMPDDGVNDEVLGQVRKECATLHPERIIHLVGRRIQDPLATWAAQQRALRILARHMGVPAHGKIHIGNGWEHVMGVLAGNWYSGLSTALLLKYEEVPA